MHARMGEVVYASAKAAASDDEGGAEKGLREAMRWFCRSVELCDDYLRGRGAETEPARDGRAGRHHTTGMRGRGRLDGLRSSRADRGEGTARSRLEQGRTVRAAAGLDAMEQAPYLHLPSAHDPRRAVSLSASMARSAPSEQIELWWKVRE